MKKGFLAISFLTSLIIGCQSNTQDDNKVAEQVDHAVLAAEHIKPFNVDLPTIGLLMNDGVLRQCAIDQCVWNC